MDDFIVTCLLAGVIELLYAASKEGRPFTGRELSKLGCWILPVQIAVVSSDTKVVHGFQAVMP